MRNNLIETITNYIDYLRSSVKLQVSFCNIANYYEAYMHILYPYNSHYNAFCKCIKNVPNAIFTCIEKQKTVVEKCKNGAFYGSCWAGMEEYVFPIYNGSESIGFISVSGYRGQISSSLDKLEKVGKQYNLNTQALKQCYLESTTKEIPNMEKLATLIDPLCIMLERLYLENPKPEKQVSKFSVYEKILDYLCMFYMTPTISLDSIATSLNYSKSYIRQVFNKYSGQNIGDYLISLRIKNAKELLITTKMPISAISTSIGCPDANYFSALFKKKTGYSPKQYRLINGTTKYNATLLDYLNEKIDK